MGLDTGNPVTLPAMTAAFTADVILSALLIFLWLVQRKEKHALFWGLGQFAVMAGTVLWIGGRQFMPELVWLYLCGLLLAVALMGYWGGTQFFLGKLERRHTRWALPAALLFAAAFCAVAQWRKAWIMPASIVLLGLVMCWSGAQLMRLQNRYRLLGLTLVVRGGMNLLLSASDYPNMSFSWFITATLLKSMSMLGLIYAVQDEIQQRYINTIDTLSRGFLIRDRRGYIHVANERCARLLGFGKASDLIGMHVCDLLPNLKREAADEYFRRFEAEGVQYPLSDTVVFHLHNGARLPVEMLGSPYVERGQLYCLVQLLDISERVKKDELLHRAAHVDPVTGYLNRLSLAQRLAQEVLKAAEAGRECAVLFIDLDRFKRVNDSFGHVVGDELLRAAANRLHRMLRPADALARFGGDEFIVVIGDLPAGTAEHMAATCAAQVVAVMAQNFELSHHAVGISASVGIACYPQHGRDGDTLVRNADIAMYEAKKAGRGEMRFFNEAMNAAARDALVIDGAMRGAIEAGEFHLLYQPIVDARSSRLTKMEALLRWHSPQLGAVSPDRFIPVAEDSGAIVALGRWVLEEACRQMGAWRGGPLDQVTVSINVSAWQLAHPDFLQLVAQALAANGLQPRQLELELTERVLIDDDANVRSVLAQLRVQGVGISLDDFGTGYSSLSYLTRFQLNTLKIDRAFVRDIEHSPRSHSLVHAIIAMGHSLGLQLVAEGVETEGQAAILEKMGCHHLQGYHISRPVPPGALLQFAAQAQARPQADNFVI